MKNGIMLKSLLYKEWIKIRVVAVAALGISIVALANIFLKVRHDILFTDAANYWYSFLFRGASYFDILRYMPLLFGLAVALAQYVPEIVNRRIKLTFHLPMSENGVLIRMHLFGTAVLTLLLILTLGLFSAGSAIFFPANIVKASVVTMLPWFMGGVATYFLVALILLEPVWLYRGLYTLIAAGYITFYYKGAAIEAYRPMLLPLALITILIGSVVLFSGYRFRKGEM